MSEQSSIDQNSEYSYEQPSINIENALGFFSIYLSIQGADDYVYSIANGQKQTNGWYRRLNIGQAILWLLTDRTLSIDKTSMEANTLLMLIYNRIGMIMPENVRITNIQVSFPSEEFEGKYDVGVLRASLVEDLPLKILSAVKAKNYEPDVCEVIDAIIRIAYFYAFNVDLKN